MSDTPVLYDFSGVPVGTTAGGGTCAPLTGRPNQALQATYQGGLVTLGSDYGSTAKAQAPKVDAYGTQYVAVANPAGQPAQVFTGQTVSSSGTQYGNLLMARMDSPTPATFQALTTDMNGNLYVHPRSKPTFRTVMKAIPAALNKHMAVVVNAAASSMVLRLTCVMTYVVPAGSTGALLGSSGSTYYPLRCELYRTAATNVSAGTSAPCVACDSNDNLGTSITALVAPTVSGTLATLFRNDVVPTIMTGEHFYQRDDGNNKSIVLRPGEAVGLICTDDGKIANSSGGTTNNAPVDIQFVFTQAPA